MDKKHFPIYNIEELTYSGEETDFYANTFSAYLKQRPKLIKPHKHNFFQSILFTKGSCKQEIDFNTYTIKPGSLFLIFPGQVHNWTLSPDIEGYIFFHTREFYDLNFTGGNVTRYPFYNSIHNSSLLQLKNATLKKVESIFKEIVDEYQNTELMKFQKLCSLVNCLYIDLSRLYLPQKQMAVQNDNYMSKTKKLEDLINTNYKTTKFPKDYAKMMHISEKHLNRITKNSLDKTITELITTRIILEAKRMLVHSKYSVSQIASELGYLENSYFFRMFKKNSGRTPIEFMHKFRSEKNI